MSDAYLDIANIADNGSMLRRVAACAAQQSAPGDPTAWAWDNRLHWAAAPGWGAAWASALAGNIEDPGADPAVITDPQILAQVQAMLAG